MSLPLTGFRRLRIGSLKSELFSVSNGGEPPLSDKVGTARVSASVAALQKKRRSRAERTRGIDCAVRPPFPYEVSSTLT